MEELRKNYDQIKGKNKYKLEKDDIRAVQDMCKKLIDLVPAFNFNCNACMGCNFEHIKKKAKSILGD